MRMKSALLGLCVLMLAACSTFTKGDSGGASGASVDAATYVNEFPDIPIPREMKVVAKYTYIVHNQDGTKAGTQVFEGNVELQSLMNAMIYNMGQQGWLPRSVFRSPRSAMVFEKGNSMALITATEGILFSTEMALWVAKKINAGALQPRENVQNLLPSVIEGNPI
jgi:hypothetical protein